MKKVKVKSQSYKVYHYIYIVPVFYFVQKKYSFVSANI